MLEQRLGTKLVQRSTRSLQITEAGERFYRRCIDITHAIDAAETEVRDLASDPSGVLKITIPLVLATPDFASLLQSFTAAHPGISLNIEVSNDPKNLIDKNLDIGFRVGALKDSRLIAIRLYQAEIVMCGSPDYLVSQGHPEDVAALQAHRTLIPSLAYLPPYAIQSNDSTSTFHLENYILCDNASLLIELAKKGVGLAMVWASYVQAELQAGTLVQINSPIQYDPRPVSLVYTSRDYQPRRLSLFIDHVKRHYNYLGE